MNEICAVLMPFMPLWPTPNVKSKKNNNYRCSASHCIYQRGYVQFARILLITAQEFLASWVGYGSVVRVSASYRCTIGALHL